MNQKSKKIGEGWDYTVYQIPSRRVIKIPKTPRQLLWLLVRTLNIIPAWKVFWSRKVLPNRVQASTDFVKTLLKKNSELAWFFGKPLFLDDNVYEQNKVFAIRELLNGTYFRAKKDLIDGYVTAIHFMWQHHFSDTSFKFSKNYGTDTETRKIILLDFSNLTTDKAETAKMIQGRYFLKTWVYRKMTDRKLKRYYKETVLREFTLEKLNEFWK